MNKNHFSKILVAVRACFPIYLVMAWNFSQTAALNVTFLLIATIVLLLRCNIRYRVLKNHGKEDILVICAWVYPRGPRLIPSSVSS